MTLSSAPRPIARPGASTGVVVAFRKPDRRTAAEYADMEALAFADEVAAHAERLQMAVSGRSWEAVNGEALRLGSHAVAFRSEYQRLRGGSPDAA